METWKPVPGCRGYDVSDLGRVRSWRMRGRTAKGRNIAEPRIMGLSRGHQGYLFVHLTDDAGANHIEPVGRLVMLAFVGPCPEGTRVRYGPGGKADCSLANLSYGRNPGNSTLTPEMVAAIKAELASPARPSLSSIARRHGVSVPCIWDISRGHSWGHIEPLPMTG